MAKESPPKSKEPLSPLQKSRTWSAEFILFYAIAGLVFFPGVFYISTSVSSQWDTIRNRHLRDGWFDGWRIDLYDSQWRNFRSSIPLLTGYAAFYLVLSRTVRSKFPEFLSLFQCVMGVITALAIHGSCAFFILVIVLSNYGIASSLRGHSTAPIVTWVFHAVVLYFNETYSGYSFGDLFGSSFSFLDNHRGMIPWHWIFNICSLRMISYNMDLYWATNRPLLDRRDSFSVHKSACDQCISHGESGSCYRWRVRNSAPLPAFTLHRYLAFVLYAPLLIAGPITSFNAFDSHARASQKTYSVGAILRYAFALFAEIILMELLLQFCHPWTIAMAETRSGQKLWRARNLTFVQMMVNSYILINALWLKFLIMWKFFRLWALADGVETIENMQRCVNNNYSVQGFWKGWHVSFNRWLIRYVYIPLGGSKGPFSRRVLNIFIVFVFVAMWHDMTANLLIWGIAMAGFLAPEMYLTHASHSPSLAHIRAHWLYRYACALAAAFNMLVLMSANLVGYGGGKDDVWWLLGEFGKAENAPYVILMVFCVCIGALFMFEIREAEKRRKFSKKLTQHNQTEPDVIPLLKKQNVY
eukprot:463783_1